MTQHDEPVPNPQPLAASQPPDAVEGASVLPPLPDEPIILRLLHEELTADKTWQQVGTLILRKRVVATPQELPLDLAYEEVTVERVPVGRVLDPGEQAPMRHDGETLIIPVVEEEVVVIKRRVVREEIRVYKQRQMRQEIIRDVVQHEVLELSTSGDLELDQEPTTDDSNEVQPIVLDQR